MAYDPTDPKQVKEKKSGHKLRVDQDASDIKALLAIEPGRRFLARLLGNAGVYRPIFALNSLEIARNAAEHDWCQWLIADLQRCEPGIVGTLAEEAKLKKWGASGE